MADTRPSVLRIVAVPALITLAITLLRLIGELQRWPDLLFSRAPGGGGAIVGISWLAFAFAIYFAVKLQGLGDGPPSKAIGWTLVALAVWVGISSIGVVGATRGNTPLMIVGALGTMAGLAVMIKAWPSYGKVMLAYALAARIPVIVVSFVAMRGAWGTHYDVAPPGDRVWTDWSRKFIEIGLVPQLFFWIPYTVILCGLFGVIVAQIRKRQGAAAPA